MLLLVTVNISNPGNVRADSGYIFTKTVLENVLELRPEWTAIVAAPHEAQFEHKRISHLRVPTVSSKYEARFAFEWRLLAQALNARSEEIGLIWVNQAETAGGLAMLVRQLEGRRVPSFVYFHYPVVISCDDRGLHYDPSLNDWGAGELILRRQHEALNSSEFAAIGSNFARRLLLDSFRSASLPIPAEKLLVLPPPVDFPMARDVGLFCDSPPTILYNHRLYDHYGTEQLIEWMAEFGRNFRKPYSLLVTDALGERTRLQERLDASVGRARERLAVLPYARIVAPSSRPEYLAHVRSATVGLAPFRASPPWSMSCADVMASGRPVLAPHSGPFPEMLGDRSSLLFHDQADFIAKLTALVTSADAWHSDATYCLGRSAAFNGVTLGEEFARLFERAAATSHN